METKKIKSFILKKGNKLTNAEMAQKLGVPTMTFAGVLAAMKRKGEISNDFLKSDNKKSSPKKSTKKSTRLSISVGKIAIIKADDLTKELVKKLAKHNQTLIKGERFYHNEAFMSVLENQNGLLANDELSKESLKKIDGIGSTLEKFDYIQII